MKTLQPASAGESSAPPQQTTVPYDVTIVTPNGEQRVTLQLDAGCEYLPGGRLAHLKARTVFFSEKAAYAYLCPPLSRARDFPNEIGDNNRIPAPDGPMQFDTARGLLYAARYGI